MNETYIKAVYRAAEKILNSHLGIHVTPGKALMRKDAIFSNDLSVVLGVSGELTGQIICCVDETGAKKIAGTMMGGIVVPYMDEISWSAMQEFGNWIAGAAATELSKENYIIDVTPPVINEGTSTFRAANTFITVPIDTDIGEVIVHISLSAVTEKSESQPVF